MFRHQTPEGNFIMHFHWSGGCEVPAKERDTVLFFTWTWNIDDLATHADYVFLKEANTALGHKFSH